MAYINILLCVTCVGSVSLFKIDESQINQWSLKFKANLDSHIDKVLGYSEVQSMLQRYEHDLIIVPVKGEESFNRILNSVNSKYSELLQAVTKTKSGIEKVLSSAQSDEPDKHSPRAQSLDREMWDNPGAQTPGVGPRGSTGPPTGGAGPAPPLLPSGGGPPPPLPGIPDKPVQRCCVPGARKYDGRFREEVQMTACYENLDETLGDISKSGIENIFKENLVNSSITWQYFADKEGHYVQYPGNARMCNNASPNTTSPLLSDWFTEKLYMERKNLVILIDNGWETTSNPQQPSDRELIIAAVKDTLKTLAPGDKVNIVTLSPSGSGARTPAGCADKLYVASQGNLDKLADYASNLPYGTGSSSLTESLAKVYQLYTTEQKNNKAGFMSRTNLVLLLMSGKSTAISVDASQLYSLIATQQKQLDHSVQHFVYIVGQSSNSSLSSILAQVADQNNGKVKASKPWPEIPTLVEQGKPVGKDGVLDVIENRMEFPVAVSTYFQRLPPQLDTQATTTIVPVLDKYSGVVMSIAAAVYGQDKTSAVGVTAVDASLAEVFSSLIGVDVGIKSYGFLVDTTHGHVLLHPKLRDASDDRHDNSLFPRLQLLEPDLTEPQIQAILKAKESISTLNVSLETSLHAFTNREDLDQRVPWGSPLIRGLLYQISHGRTLITGELVRTENKQREQVTLYYQLVYGSSLCVVFCHFLSDREEARMQKTQQGQTMLHAPYHRLDELVPAPVANKPDTDNVCHLYGNFLSFKESVIKLSPWVFKNPVLYKYSRESVDQIHELNKFLINDGNTSLIREDLKQLIQHFVRSTDNLDKQWKNDDRKVNERFLGSTSGVFRLYPGSPLVNTFDHMQTDWYRRSVAFPDVTMYHYGRLSSINHGNVLIITRALTDKGRLQGVIGMTTTRRLLTAQLVNSIKECYRGDQQCHVVDSSGNILDSFLTEDVLHLTEMYPWLTTTLNRKGRLVVDWCTGFSDGYHKNTFTLTQSVTSDLNATDPCRKFSLQSVNGTNLFILILGNRTQLKCDDKNDEICTSCQEAVPTGPYSLALPRCQLCLSNYTTHCQCQCFCDSDIDPCEGQFQVNKQDFPKDACFYPVKQNTRLELLPESAGPDNRLEFCPLPCAAVEDIDICVQLEHCKMDTNMYPTCIWKEGEELTTSNISLFFPTSLAPTLSSPQQTVTQHTGSLTVTRLATSASPANTSKPTQLTTHREKSTQSQTPQTSKQPTQKTARVQTTQLRTTKSSTNVPQESTNQPPRTSTQPTTDVSGPTSQSAVTDSQIPLILDASTTRSASVSSTANTSRSENPVAEGMSGGAIAGLVIGILVLLVIMSFVAVKVYKTFHSRPAVDSSVRYRARNSLFDSTIFHRGTEQVVTGISQSSNVPYEEIQQP